MPVRVLKLPARPAHGLCRARVARPAGACRRASVMCCLPNRSRVPLRSAWQPIPPPDLAGLILCGTFARNPFPWLRAVRALAVRVPFKSLPRWLRAPLLWGSGDPRRAPPRASVRVRSSPEAVITAALARGADGRRHDEPRRHRVAHPDPAARPATASCRAPRAAARAAYTRHARAGGDRRTSPFAAVPPRGERAAVLRFLRRWN